jgi:FdhD protein
VDPAPAAAKIVTARATIASVRRVDGDDVRVDQDLVAVEAPLAVEIVTHDGAVHPLGLVMRTPGDDRDLVLGLLHGEGIVRRMDQIASVEFESGDDGSDRARVHVAASVSLDDVPEARRQLLSSACGLCGRLSIAQLDARVRRSSTAFPRDRIAGIPAALRLAQPIFAETGGLHAAALFDQTASLVHQREDIGRHNAVDKAIGAALSANTLDAVCGLAVSGRVAYEIVQKAALAGLSLIVAVGAPSSLAVQAARMTGLTLVGFVREGRFNIYAGSERVTA